MNAHPSGGHQDYRFRRGWGGTLPPELDKRTSNVPFWAMLTGSQDPGGAVESFKKLSGEIKYGNALLACLLAAGMALRRRP